MLDVAVTLTGAPDPTSRDDMVQIATMFDGDERLADGSGVEPKSEMDA